MDTYIYIFHHFSQLGWLKTLLMENKNLYKSHTLNIKTADDLATQGATATADI